MAFELPKGALPDGLYWDTLEAYHYVRSQPGSDKKDFLIVGGCDHNPARQMMPMPGGSPRLPRSVPTSCLCVT